MRRLLSDKCLRYGFINAKALIGAVGMILDEVEVRAIHEDVELVSRESTHARFSANTGKIVAQTLASLGYRWFRSL